MQLLLFTAALSTVLVIDAGKSCSQSAKKLDTCLIGVEKSTDYKSLKENEKKALDDCVKQNAQATCQMSASAAGTCRENARSDTTLKAALKTMYSDIDACLVGNVVSPYSVLRMTGDMGMVGRNKPGKGKGGGGNRGPTTTPAPVVLVNTDTDADASAASGTPAPSNCPSAAPSDPTGLLGGSSTDISGSSDSSDPTNLFAGLLPAAGAAGGANGGFSLDSLTSLGRKRRQTANAGCKVIADCIAASKTSDKRKSRNDVNSKASRIYDAIQKCKSDYSPSFECVPSSKTEKECILKARKAYKTQLVAFMKTCLNTEADKATN